MAHLVRARPPRVRAAKRSNLTRCAEHKSNCRGASPPLLIHGFHTIDAHPTHWLTRAQALPYMETLLRDRGYEGRGDMLIKVEVGVPEDLVDSVSVEDIRAMFPYGRMLPVEVRAGGLDFQSGRVVEALGDAADRAVVAVAAVTVGF